jgi:hypothetical protein
MREVTARFHTGSEVNEEKAFYLDGILLSDYQGSFVFRVLTHALKKQDVIDVYEYRTVELSEKVSVDQIEPLSLLDYVKLIAK